MFGRTTAGVPNDWLRAAPLPTVLLALLASGAPAQTFTVNTTSDADDGACTVVHCSLREAIQEANAAVDAVVAFDIPGPGPHTIRPLGLLPDVVGPLTIDGTTEPGYLGTPLIELDGSLAGAVHGLNVAGPDNVIRGLAVNRFVFAGLYLGTQATRTVVEGCFIGTDVTGTVGRGNGQAGVVIEGSSDHRIGGSTPAERNIISGNTEGVTIMGVLATYNQVIGNYIGTDVTGTSAIANDMGVLLLAPLNWIGGENPGEGNLIAGNRFNGVMMGAPTTTGNTVAGNFIGTDATGSVALGNDVGIWIDDAASNIVGGETPGARNVISGNREGVTLWIAGATMNLVIGNYVGTDANGSFAIPNERGVVVYGPSNTVGGFAPGTGNLISGNLWEGVSVNGPLAINNLVQGNWVGTDASGQSALPNGQAGIFVNDASGTLVGGPQQGAGNLVSGNGGSGIFILGSLSDANVVQGNWVGVTLNGDQALPNAADGIYVDGATGTWIGGPGTHEGNLTSGNGAWGVHLWGGTDNLLEGNLIGLTPDGAAALGNAEGGVFIQDTPDNFIGSAGQGGRNVISGHTGAGIMIVGDPSTGNVIQGNYIGTNISGDAALSNETGVLLFAPETQIGGSAAGEGNLISGNANMGIDIAAGRTATLIEGNLIGTDAAGIAAVGNSIGIWVNGAVDTRIGGAGGAGNVISGNTVGVQIGAGATGTSVLGNRIGVNVSDGALGNAAMGIHLYQDAYDNVIGGPDPAARNTIAHNGSAGIRIDDAGSVGNQIIGNAIHGNGQLGIDIHPDGVNDNDSGDVDTGPNGRLNHPVVMGVAAGGGVMAKALMFDGLANEPYTFEFFGNEQCDASGYGEGAVPLGTVQITSAADGDASIAIPVAATTHLSATATDGAGNTSEFGACVALADFTIAISPARQTIQAGGTATYQVTVSTVGGPFSDAIELDCSGGPAGSMCTFAEPELIPGDQSATTTMTIVTPSTLRAAVSGWWGWTLVLAAGLGLALLPAKRRRRLPAVAAALVGVVALGVVACGDDGTGPSEPNPVTYDLQVTGEWEGLTHGETATLVVN